jgi:hypothetical protein
MILKKKQDQLKLSEPMRLFDHGKKKTKRLSIISIDVIFSSCRTMRKYQH